MYRIIVLAHFHLLYYDASIRTESGDTPIWPEYRGSAIFLSFYSVSGFERVGLPEREQDSYISAYDLATSSLYLE